MGSLNDKLQANKSLSGPTIHIFYTHFLLKIRVKLWQRICRSVCLKFHCIYMNFIALIHENSLSMTALYLPLALRSHTLEVVVETFTKY